LYFCPEDATPVIVTNDKQFAAVAGLRWQSDLHAKNYAREEFRGYVQNREAIPVHARKLECGLLCLARDVGRETSGERRYCSARLHTKWMMDLEMSLDQCYTTSVLHHI